MFSHRTSWQRHPNRLAQLYEERRYSGLPILDLTVSNPTELELDYPLDRILHALQNRGLLHYQPDPKGLLTARLAVCQYYAEKAVFLDPANIILTSSTSESYGLLLKLLCNQGETILVPSPSYPLFEYLAQINDIGMQNYSLLYDGRWHIDIESIRTSMSPSTRVIILLNPHNPTGSFLQVGEFDRIAQIAQEHNCSLIVDEVFIDYKLDPNAYSQTTASTSEVLTFTLNGISKYIGLPQMKLGWITVSGPAETSNEAIARLEILNDTFLSVNTPVQIALPELLQNGKDTFSSVLRRIKGNHTFLQNSFLGGIPCDLFHSYGGWNAIIQMPRTKSDEMWALELLDKKGVYVYPGYFFDMLQSSVIVVSLLQRGDIFRQAIEEIFSYVRNSVC